MSCDGSITSPELDDAISEEERGGAGDSCDQCGREKQVSDKFASQQLLGEVGLVMKQPTRSQTAYI